MPVPTPDEVNAFVSVEYPAAYAAGFRCVHMEPDRCVARWSYDVTQLRPGQYISGPTQFFLADLSLWYVTFTILGLAPMAVTSDLHISFLRPAVGGDLFAEARVLRAGKTRITGDVRLWIDGSPKRLVAHAVGSYARTA